MTNTEQLAEAILYSEEDGCNWWEVFDSMAQAKRVINAAIKETAEENEMICILSALDVDMFGSCTLEVTYLQALRKLKKELNKA